MSTDDLDVAASIETPTGWLDLEDEASGYELSYDSFSAQAVSHRKTVLQSEWIEGSFITRSVRENITEKVSVYVRGDTPFMLAERLARLTDGFDQLSFAMVVRFADSQETWSCSTSEYTISTKQEMRFATMALVSADVPRLPTLDRVQVYP
jgi:hypothetical protein